MNTLLRCIYCSAPIQQQYNYYPERCEYCGIKNNPQESLYKEEYYWPSKDNYENIISNISSQMSKIDLKDSEQIIIGIAFLMLILEIWVQDGLLFFLALSLLIFVFYKWNQRNDFLNNGLENCRRKDHSYKQDLSGERSWEDNDNWEEGDDWGNLTRAFKDTFSSLKEDLFPERSWEDDDNWEEDDDWETEESYYKSQDINIVDKDSMTDFLNSKFNLANLMANISIAMAIFSFAFFVLLSHLEQSIFPEIQGFNTGIIFLFGALFAGALSILLGIIGLSPIRINLNNNVTFCGTFKSRTFSFISIILSLPLFILMYQFGKANSIW